MKTVFAAAAVAALALAAGAASAQPRQGFQPGGPPAGPSITPSFSTSPHPPCSTSILAPRLHSRNSRNENLVWPHGRSGARGRSGCRGLHCWCVCVR